MNNEAKQAPKDVCWKGYQMVGMKMKNGREVPNCVPIKEVEGGLSKGMTVNAIAEKHGVTVDDIKAQLKMGIKVEKEHTDSNTKAAKIAMDHLAEDPKYYDKLKDMEQVDELNEGPNSPAYKGPVGYDDGCDCYPNDPDENVNELYEGNFCKACLAEYIREHANMLQEAEYQGRKVALGKPMRGDVKKFKVYVKDPKTGNVKKVNFGDKTMKIKKSNPARRKSFRARHKCSTAKDRTSARYWSCRKW